MISNYKSKENGTSLLNYRIEYLEYVMREHTNLDRQQQRQQQRQQRRVVESDALYQPWIYKTSVPSGDCHSFYCIYFIAPLPQRRKKLVIIDWKWLNALSYHEGVTNTTIAAAATDSNNNKNNNNNSDCRNNNNNNNNGLISESIESIL